MITGAVLRERREDKGWSRPDLARKLRAASPTPLPSVASLTDMIKQWENGRVSEPSRLYQQLLGQLLGTAPTPPAVQNFEQSGLPTPVRHDGPVAPELVDYFAGQLGGHYQADMMLGPRALIGTVTAQSDLLTELLDAADGPVRQRLTEVGTAYRAFIGWLHLDAGDAPAAALWHGAALELAHRSMNRDAVACTLVDLAMAHTDQGRGGAVVDLCRSALTDASRLSPEVQVFALQQQAHGVSLLPSDDRRAVDQLLDDAADAVARVDVEQWGTACLRTPNYVEIQRATCYGRLGLLDDAARLWEQLIPPDTGRARRDVGVWTARHAVVRARAGAADHALDLARTAVPIVSSTRSARALRVLADLEDAMTPWQDAPEGRELAEILAPVKGA
ncbi:helix-turn-helix domain-containing protein [Actinocorallia aurea]